MRIALVTLLVVPIAPPSLAGAHALLYMAPPGAESVHCEGASSCPRSQ
jgi:hypothetical protein